MGANKSISQLPLAGTLDGTELAELVKDGESVQSTTQAIADLGGGGGGGISGVAPVGNVAKVATVDTGDVILTLDESSISDLDAGLSISKVAVDSQYLNLLAKNTTDNVEAQLNLNSDSTTNTYQAYLLLADASLTSGLYVSNILTELKVANTGGADIIKLQIDGAAKTLKILTDNYPTNGLFLVDAGNNLVHFGNDDSYIETILNTGVTTIKSNTDTIVTADNAIINIGNTGDAAVVRIDSAAALITIGDALGVGNGANITINDGTEIFEINATNGVTINGSPGVDGGWTAGGVTVTVTKGIITSIV